MKNLRKAMSVALVTLMMIGMVGCGQKTQEQKANNAKENKIEAEKNAKQEQAEANAAEQKANEAAKNADQAEKNAEQQPAEGEQAK